MPHSPRPGALMPLPRMLLALAAAGLLLAPPAHAVELPRQITFQGRLVRADGTPETAPQSLRFSLYATPSGGAPLWEESHPSVPVTNGYYAVVLGAATPLPASALNGQALYLGVSLVGQSELTPRLPVVSVPYALLAEDSHSLEGRAAASFADASHSHPNATPSAHGLMSSADKAKLNGLPSNFGAGLSSSGSTLSVSFPSSGGTNGTASSAARSNHSHALSCTYRTATGNTDGGKGATAYCLSSETITGGGCENLGETATAAGVSFSPTGVSFVDSPNPTGGPGYACRALDATQPPTAHAICCRI